MTTNTPTTDPQTGKEYILIRDYDDAGNLTGFRYQTKEKAGL